MYKKKYAQEMKAQEAFVKTKNEWKESRRVAGQGFSLNFMF